MPNSDQRVIDILRNAPVTDADRDAMWQSYTSAASKDDFRRAFDAINAPREVKAQLWEAKFSAAAAAPKPVQSEPPKSIEPQPVQTQPLVNHAVLDAQPGAVLTGEPPSPISDKPQPAAPPQPPKPVQAAPQSTPVAPIPQSVRRAVDDPLGSIASRFSLPANGALDQLDSMADLDTTDLATQMSAMPAVSPAVSVQRESASPPTPHQAPQPEKSPAPSPRPINPALARLDAVDIAEVTPRRTAAAPAPVKTPIKRYPNVEKHFESLGDPASDVAFIVPHGDEQTAKEITREHVSKNGGYALLARVNTRNIGGVDPNRIYGVPSAISDLGSEVTENLWSDSRKHIVALHNTYGGQLDKELKRSDKVSLNDRNSKNFILTNNPAVFDMLAGQKRHNVVLQTARTEENNDGSLSRYSIGRGKTYVNVEAVRGDKQGQSAMLRDVMSALPAATLGAHAEPPKPPEEKGFLGRAWDVAKESASRAAETISTAVQNTEVAERAYGTPFQGPTEEERGEVQAANERTAQVAQRPVIPVSRIAPKEPKGAAQNFVAGALQRAEQFTTPVDIATGVLTAIAAPAAPAAAMVLGRLGAGGMALAATPKLKHGIDLALEGKADEASRVFGEAGVDIAPMLITEAVAARARSAAMPKTQAKPKKGNPAVAHRTNKAKPEEPPPVTAEPPKPPNPAHPPAPEPEFALPVVPKEKIRAALEEDFLRQQGGSSPGSVPQEPPKPPMETKSPDVFTEAQGQPGIPSPDRPADLSGPLRSTERHHPVTVRSAGNFDPSVPQEPPRPISDMMPKPTPPQKPLWEMNPDELGMELKRATQSDKDIAIDLFGAEGAKKYEAAYRKSNSSTDPKGADRASQIVAEMEDSLTPQQRNRLYGIGEPEAHDPELIKSYMQSVGGLDWDSPQALGSSLRWAVSRVAEHDDPLKMTDAERIAHATLRYAAEQAEQLGWDASEWSRAALESAASRFKDPEDAAFMLRRFLNPDQWQQAEPPTPPLQVAEPPVPPQVGSRTAVADGDRGVPEGQVQQTPSRAQEGGSPVPAPEPSGRVQTVPTESLSVDPVRFQFKSNVGKGGVSDKMKDPDVEWNPNLAGVLAVWKDPANGKDYVINGHHRYDKAVRAGVPDLDVKFIQARDAQQARAIGALINIGEGQGTALDAAKVIRDMNWDDAMLKKHGIHLKGGLAKEARSLSRLSPELFSRVASGEMDEDVGVAIGNLLSAPEDQKAAADLIAHSARSGERLTSAEAEDLIKIAQNAPKVEVQTENYNLFGNDTEVRNLAVKQAKLATAIRNQLSQEKKLFSTVGKESTAAKLGAAGNTIKAEENAKIAQEAKRALEVFNKLYTSSGPVSKALADGAIRIARGENESAVRKQVYESIRTAVAEVLQGGNRGDAGSVGATGAGRGVETGPRPDAVRPRGTGGRTGVEPPTSSEPPTLGGSAFQSEVAAFNDARDAAKLKAQMQAELGSKMYQGDPSAMMERDSPLFGGKSIDDSPAQASLISDEPPKPPVAPKRAKASRNGQGTIVVGKEQLPIGATSYYEDAKGRKFEGIVVREVPRDEHGTQAAYGYEVVPKPKTSEPPTPPAEPPKPKAAKPKSEPTPQEELSQVRAEIAKWQSKSYQQSDRVVYTKSTQDVGNVTKINEGRRRKKIAELEARAKELEAKIAEPPKPPAEGKARGTTNAN